MTRHRWLYLVPLLALVLSSTTSAHETAKPQIVTSPPPMDSPIPPGDGAPAPPALELTQGMGYCVTYDGSKVDVPFHRPDRDHLAELRSSLKNALELVANQLDVKAAIATDQAGRRTLAGKAGKLHAKLERGVRFAWEPVVSPDASRPVMVTDPGGVTCTCSTLMDAGGTLPSGYSCGGPCGNCWSCR